MGEWTSGFADPLPEYLEDTLVSAIGAVADGFRSTLRGIPDMPMQVFLHRLIDCKTRAEDEEAADPLAVVEYALMVAEAAKRWDDDPAPRYLFRRAARKVGIAGFEE